MAANETEMETTEKAKEASNTAGKVLAEAEGGGSGEAHVNQAKGTKAVQAKQSPEKAADSVSTAANKDDKSPALDSEETNSGGEKTTSNEVAGPTRRIPNRPGITWGVGERIEAMDYLSKWYPAKMLGVDESDMTVLIHFEGWNQRYDEWVPMHSDKLRPLTRTSDRTKTKSKSSSVHRVGDKVLARWSDGKMYPGKVTSMKSKADCYEIMFSDGCKKLIPMSQVKTIPPEMKYKNFEAPPIKHESSRRSSDPSSTVDPLSPIIREGKRIRRLSLVQRESLRDSMALEKQRAENRRGDKRRRDRHKSEEKGQTETSKPDVKPVTVTPEDKPPPDSGKGEAGVQTEPEETVKPKAGGRARQDSGGKGRSAEKTRERSNSAEAKAEKIEMKRRSSSKDGDTKKPDRSQKLALRKGGKLIVAGAFSRFKTGHSPTSTKKSDVEAESGKGSTKSPGVSPVAKDTGPPTPVSSGEKKVIESPKEAPVKSGKLLKFMDAFERFAAGEDRANVPKPRPAYKKSVSESGHRKRSQASPSRRKSAPARPRKSLSRSPRKPVRRPVAKKAAAVKPRTRKSAPGALGGEDSPAPPPTGKQTARSSSPKPVPGTPVPEAPLPEVLPLSAPKEFVVEEDHNPFKCTYEGCAKSFRKQNLLEYHVKYYHSNNGKPPAPPPPRKRRKTSSICSTDSDSSVSLTPNAKPTPTSAPAPSKRRRNSSSISLPTDGAAPPSLPDVVEEVMTPAGDASCMSAVPRPRPLGEGRPVSQDVSDDVMDVEEADREEVVNCHCGMNEENGLMIQCEVCFCWQHASCFNITPQTLPQRYVCYVCLNPPGVREGCRFIYNHEDWVRHGYLPEFPFTASVPERDRRAAAVRTTNALLGDMYNIKTVLQGTRQKLNILQKGEEPGLSLWYRRWDREFAPCHSTDTTLSADSSHDLANASPNGMEEGGECKGFASEHSYSVARLNTYPPGQGDLPQRSSTPSVEPHVGGGAELSAEGAESKPLIDSEGAPEAVMDMKHDEIEAGQEAVPQSKGAESGLDNKAGLPDDKAVGPSPSDMDRPSGQTATDTPWEVAPEIAEHNYQKSGTGDTPSIHLTNESVYGTPGTAGDQDVSRPVDGPSGSQSEVLDETEQMMELMVAADPVRLCKENLLDHIEGLQLDICRRLDSIEEQVLALESVDSEPVSEGNLLLADMPVLKRSLKALVGDLGKVKRLAAFGM